MDTIVARWSTASLLLRRHAVATAIAAVVLGAGTPLALHAQASYGLSAETAPYRELVNAETVPVPLGDSSGVIELAGTYQLFSTHLAFAGERGLQIGGNGFVEVVIDSTVTVIDALFTELAPRDERSAVRYRVEAAEDDQVLKVEWRNVGFKAGVPSDSANVQLWLYQKTGVIEMHYGPGSVTSATAFGNGPWAGIFTAPADFSKMIEKCWIYGDPTKPRLDTARSFAFRRLGALPADGTVYRLTPRAAAGIDRGESGNAATNATLIPNPAQTTAELATDGRAYESYEIFDAGGRRVGGGAVEGRKRFGIAIGTLPSGAYTVTLRGADAVATCRFVKQ